MAATTQFSLTQTSELLMFARLDPFSIPTAPGISGVATATFGNTGSDTPSDTPTSSTASKFVGTSLSSASNTTPNSSINTTSSAPAAFRPISPLVPATVGSLVGVLVIVICGLLFYLRYRRRRRFQVTPLVNSLRDEENSAGIMSQPTQHLVQHEKQALSEAVNESEATPSSSRTPSPSPSPQIDHRHPNDLIPENIPTQGDDHAIRLQLQMAEMKVTVDRMMDRMMEQVQRIEARVGSSTNRERDLESISSSDGPPPTYVSS